MSKKTDTSKRGAAAGSSGTSLPEQIIADLTSGVLSVDNTGVISIANAAACQHLDLSARELHPGVHIAELAGLSQLAALFEELMESGGGFSRREIKLDTPRGRRIIGITASPTKGPEEFNGVTFLFADLTAIRELERAAVLNRQLAQIGELTAGVVHEVRNPLSVISGMSELLMRQLGDAHKNFEQASLIFQEAGQLEQLISQFLSFAKPFQVEKRRCAPENIVERAVNLCDRLARDKGAEVQVSVKRKLPYVEADESKLSQALANMIRNAIEIQKGGGTINVLVTQNDGYVAFRVEDNGPGIRLEDGENLLSPFFTKKEGGTGLGLSIVHRIATAHGGTVKYGNRDEGGAWFEIRLPLE